jgi:ribosomal protein L3 glutamine methyltransferase
MLAFDGGVHGLVPVQRIIEGAVQHLSPGGVLIGEVGASAPALSRLFPRVPFIWVELECGGEGVFVLDDLR